MLKAVIIDDERKSRENLKLLLNSFVENVSIVGMADGVPKGISTINETKPDIVFLDIHLTDGDGFQILEQLENKEQNIIFVTGHEEHAVKAFRSDAVDYLLKPVCIDHLQDAVKRVENRLSEEVKAPEKLTISTSKGVRFLHTKNIVYCKGDGAYTYIYLKNGERITTSKNLKEYETRLQGDSFFRSHKSFLVNLSEIKTYIRGDGSHAVMSNGDQVSISKRRKDGFLSAIGKA